MEILITGSNGFIGKILAEMLGKGHHIIGTGTKQESLTKTDEYVKWNLAQEDCPKELFEKNFDMIIHIAACLDKDNMSMNLVETNCVGTYRIYQLACQKRVKKVIYISGIPVIGLPLEHPITESHPVFPVTMYHATKLAGETILSQLMYQGIESVVLRLPSPIAPGMPVKTILPIFVRKALLGEDISIMGAGTRRQNYLDVRDCAEVIKNCMEVENISGVYNIASCETVSNLELAELCISLTESKSKIRFTGEKDVLDGQIWDVDTTKAKERLNYKQNYGMTDSLRDIIEEMKKQL